MTRRREFLARMGAVAVVASSPAASASAGPDPDAELRRLCGALTAAARRYDALSDEEGRLFDLAQHEGPGRKLDLWEWESAARAGLAPAADHASHSEYAAWWRQTLDAVHERVGATAMVGKAAEAAAAARALIPLVEAVEPRTVHGYALKLSALLGWIGYEQDPAETEDVEIPRCILAEARRLVAVRS